MWKVKSYNDIDNDSINKFTCLTSVKQDQLHASTKTTVDLQYKIINRHST